MREVWRFRVGVRAALVVTVVSCGDASGPGNEFMTATLDGVPWTAAAGMTDSLPSATIWQGRLSFGGSTLVASIHRVTTITVLSVPAAVGSYAVKSYVLQEEPSATVSVSTGEVTDPGFQIVSFYSDSGRVIIDSLDDERVSGTFWFDASGKSVADGAFRLRIQ